MIQKEYKAVPLNRLHSSPAIKDFQKIKEIADQRPKNKGFVEVSLQRLNDTGACILLQWWGGKNGYWYPASDIFIVRKHFTHTYP